MNINNYAAILERSPQEYQANLFCYFDGVELAKIRQVSKRLRYNIDSVEVMVYEVRLNIEYPKQYQIYKNDCYFRMDWKNLYIILDQYAVSERRSRNYRQIIINRQNFLIFEKVAMIIEHIIGSMTVVTSALRVAILGFSGSRALIQEFMRNNPHLTQIEALREMGYISRIPNITSMPNFN